MRNTIWIAISATAACTLGACTDEPVATPFELRFVAEADGTEVGCESEITVTRPTGTFTLGPSDLRFYISNLHVYDAAGRELEVELEENSFQYASPEGDVALIDLTGNTTGSCAGTAIAFAEGTARTNDVIRGRTLVGEVARVSFDVGVPQPVMREVIATSTPEAAPSPLDEMYWSWNSGYRHLVFNFAVNHDDGRTGDGYLHVGSTDCGTAGMLALADREACGRLNTPHVELTDFNLETNSVALDLDQLLEGINLLAPTYDADFNVIGEGPGAECHSSPLQPHCASLFGNLGIDLSSGASVAADNAVFVRR